MTNITNKASKTRSPLDLKSLSKLAKRGYPMSVKLLGVVRKLVNSHQPRFICETGSGFSSVVFADHCYGSGTSFISLETEQKYQRKTQQWLRSYGLEKYSDSIHLTGVKSVENGFRYVLPDLPAIDMLLIDGPSQNTYGRTGVMFSLWPILSNDCLILIDDFQRKSCKKDLKLWSKEFDFEVIETHNDKSRQLAVCRRL